MKVLVITTISGFVPKFLMQDIRMLQKRGYIVHYASNFDNPVYECDREALEEQGIVCHQIPIAKSPLAVKSNFTALRQLNRMVEQEEISVILCHNPMGGVLGRLSQGKHRKPYVIYTAHGFHFYKGAPAKNWMLFYPVEKLLAHRTNQLITINHEDKNISDTFRLRRYGSTAQIPGVGFDAERFHPFPEKRAEYRNKYGIGKKDYVFLSVGELNDNKNHKTIIEAFSQADNKGAKLFICGEGPRHGELQMLIDRLGLADKVTLWGYQKKVEEFYQSADCFLFPSIREGLGMASIEAMACGLPVIAGDNRGTREYAFLNAIVCKPMEVQAFAEAMNKMMHNSEMASDMGRKSIEIAAGFTKEKTAWVMQQVYERMGEELNGTEQEKKGMACRRSPLFGDSTDIRRNISETVYK